MSEWNFEPPEGITNRDTGLEAVLKKIRYDLTACQAKLSEAMRMVASLDLPDHAGERVPCPTCDVQLKGPRTLAEHRYQMHDGPLPPHWQEPAQALAELDPDDFARGTEPA